MPSELIGSEEKGDTLGSDVRLPVKHVSETAHMVAAFRAFESERPDALFSDPLAKRLAGEQAYRLLDEYPHLRAGEWMLSIRTAILDQWILRLVSEGTNTVLNLAAGLDSRPYRLNLPPQLRWIEADFPNLIDYKKEVLRSETPRCQLEQVAIDLRDEGARRKLFQNASQGAQRAIVLTEGLLMYLSATQVSSLAIDLFEENGIEWWMMDLMTASWVAWLKDTFKDRNESGDIQFSFLPEDGGAFFRRQGWEIVEFESFAVQGRQRQRLPAYVEAHPDFSNPDQKSSGVCLLKRQI
jgi:methyltransferase (TIGR00027 family)